MNLYHTLVYERLKKRLEMINNFDCRCFDKDEDEDGGDDDDIFLARV